MENRWILHVEKLGKIEKASITVAPLTLFVGDNNSGKSYLMELLYSLLNVRFLPQKYDYCVNTQEYKRCAEWLERNVYEKRQATEAAELTLDKTDLEIFIRLLNLILRQNKEKLVKQAFNADVSIGNICLEFPALKSVRLSVTAGREFESDKITDLLIKPLLSDRQYTGARLGHRKGVDKERGTQFLIGFILEFLIKHPFKTRAQNDAVFLPTSRTGFLLLYRTMVNQSLSLTYDVDEIQSGNTKLTRPCSDFLKNLSDIIPEDASGSFDSVIQFIEEKMVHGKLTLTGETPQKTINYIPEDTKVNLPMFLSSGVVTELAPLLLMLRYHGVIETMFIEEPEMGLHPELQLAMARVILRLCAEGVALFITTHSDTILQHINNMIKLNKLPAASRAAFMKQYDYEKSDLISPDDIAMYQLDTAKGKTEITKLTSNEYGFEIPTFNSALEKLLVQTVNFQGDEENVRE